MRFHDGSDKEIVEFCGDLRESQTETQTMIKQALGEESMSRKRKVQNHRDG
jgi:hypothetical protein